LDKVNAAWLAIYNMIPTFLEYTTDLEKAYSSNVSNRLINETTAFILGAITFLLLMALLYIMYNNNKKLESEIHQLVNELQDLGNGNLAVQATEGVGLTASIAEAVNYALKALRHLVHSINQTSEKVSVSAEDVKRIATDLNAAINHQSTEIVNVANSTTRMASSIDKVAQNAKKSAQVAENSVDIAHQGAIVVNNTIEGMERIRDQIRKTEKRIRRLGKSSQEIGEIVSLIDGISEQTNLLSLNASIQAAMAGEVGLGFAVVADEVQQLAVKSSQATKEVESLVKAIQSDTGHAVEAMEEAIAEVNAGSKLAQDAGFALDKFEKVSTNLSELIQGISQAADEQADVAGKISKMMEIIESIAGQTSKGTDVTAESISNLAALIQELRNSVAEFKLPTAQYG
jgi:twitching motility protein PilJ